MKVLGENMPQDASSEYDVLISASSAIAQDFPVFDFVDSVSMALRPAHVHLSAVNIFWMEFEKSLQAKYSARFRKALLFSMHPRQLQLLLDFLASLKRQFRKAFPSFGRHYRMLSAHILEYGYDLDEHEDVLNCRIELRKMHLRGNFVGKAAGLDRSINGADIADTEQILQFLSSVLGAQYKARLTESSPEHSLEEWLTAKERDGRAIFLPEWISAAAVSQSRVLCAIPGSYTVSKAQRALPIMKSAIEWLCRNIFPIYWLSPKSRRQAQTRGNVEVQVDQIMIALAQMENIDRQPQHRLEIAGGARSQADLNATALFRALTVRNRQVVKNSSSPHALSLQQRFEASSARILAACTEYDDDDNDDDKSACSSNLSSTYSENEEISHMSDEHSSVQKADVRTDNPKFVDADFDDDDDDDDDDLESNIKQSIKHTQLCVEKHRLALSALRKQARTNTVHEDVVDVCQSILKSLYQMIHDLCAESADHLHQREEVDHKVFLDYYSSTLRDTNEALAEWKQQTTDETQALEKAKSVLSMAKNIQSNMEKRPDNFDVARTMLCDKVVLLREIEIELATSMVERLSAVLAGLDGFEAELHDAHQASNQFHTTFTSWMKGLEMSYRESCRAVEQELEQIHKILRPQTIILQQKIKNLEKRQFAHAMIRDLHTIDELEHARQELHVTLTDVKRRIDRANDASIERICEFAAFVVGAAEGMMGHLRRYVLCCRKARRGERLEEAKDIKMRMMRRAPLKFYRKNRVIWPRLLALIASHGSKWHQSFKFLVVQFRKRPACGRVAEVYIQERPSSKI